MVIIIEYTLVFNDFLIVIFGNHICLYLKISAKSFTKRCNYSLCYY